MINNKKVLAIVPARGGSKGIPNKNLLKLNGKSLIGLVASVVKNIPEIDRCIVSTDSEKIAEDAITHGLAVPFMRPKKISGDFIGDWDVIYHAVREMERIDKTKYEYILMLQPTSPLRTAKEVLGALELLVTKGYSSVWTLSETDLKYHPLKQMKLTGTSMAHYHNSGKKVIARQELEQLYHRNGVAYAFERKCIMQTKNIWGENPGGFLLESHHVSIDTLADVAVIEALMNSKN